VWGPVSGLLGKTVGSYAALLIARRLGHQRGWTIPEKIKPKLDMLHKQPIVTMISIRLAPLPLAAKNFGLAFTDVSSPAYIAAAVAVNGPFSLMWGAIGASCHSLSDALSLEGNRSSTADTGIMGIVAVGARVVSMILCATMVCYLCHRFAANSVSDLDEEPKSQNSGEEPSVCSCAAKSTIVGTCEELKGCREGFDIIATSDQKACKEESCSDVVNSARLAVAACEKALSAGYAEPGTPKLVIDALNRANAESHSTLRLARRALLCGEMRALNLNSRKLQE